MVLMLVTKPASCSFMLRTSEKIIQCAQLVSYFVDTSRAIPLDIIDNSSFQCGAKFDAVIVSEKFEGLSLVKQQKLVFDILKEEMKTIHALSMKTMTPAEYKEQLASKTN